MRERLGWRTLGTEVACWDLVITVDGRRFFERFDTSAHADARKLELDVDFRAGLLFDPSAKRFVRAAPAALTPTVSPTVYEATLAYMGAKWREWKPKTRREAAKALHRTCLQFLVPEAPTPRGAEQAWLAWALKLPAPDASVPLGATGGEQFWARWSAPIPSVTADDLQTLLERYRVNQRHPDRLTSHDTERRFAADLRQFWDDASARNNFPNPWSKVRLRADGEPAPRAVTAAGSRVDPELVLAPTGIWWLAAACAHFGSWGGGVAAYVLLMGVCGLRPSEAVGVRIEDVELPASGPGWVTIRASNQHITAPGPDADEDPDRGSHTDRDLRGSRRAPIPGVLVAYLRDGHMPTHCDGRRRGRLFEHRGQPYDLTRFARDVWDPARAAVSPPDLDLPRDDPRQPPLCRLRQDDLRHAACSLWLNTPNVDVKIAQRWSTHRTLSVFLDTYQAVMPGREAESAMSINAAFP